MEGETSQAEQQDPEDKMTEEKFLKLRKKFIKVKQMAALATSVTKRLNLFIREIDSDRVFSFKLIILNKILYI